MRNKHNIGVLFFSRTASDEAEEKTFNPSFGKKGNTAISQILIDNTLKIIKKSGLPLIEVYSLQQRGTTFGEKIGNALEAAYNKGFENIIILGNDCPFITPRLLNKVANDLEKTPFIIGPSKEGGLYLMGISKSIYNRKRFINLPWQNINLLNGVEKYGQIFDICIEWLSPFFDINKPIDYKRLLALLPSDHNLKLQLLSIVRNILSISKTYKLFESKIIYILQLNLRGPPQPLN